MTKSRGKVARTGDTQIKINEETGKLELHWPCLLIEGMRTGDGRLIPYGSLGHRGLPLPVLGQTKTGKGHDGAEVFGRITRLERVEGPTVVSKETGQPFPEGTAVWQAWGEGDPDSEPGKLALSGYLTGNSADLADTKTIEELSDEDGKPVVELRGGNIAGTTLVPVPAFADGYVEVNGEKIEREPGLDALVASGELAESPAWRIIDDPAPVTAAADPEPFRPPVRLFQKRNLPGITPLTLERQADGTLAVYGHAADFNRPHISFTGQRVLAQPSPSGYAKGFNTGALRALDEDGEERTVAVGRLVYPAGEDGGHADLGLDAQETRAFYDRPDWAWAWVQACDDQFGVQVNGVVIPGTPDDRVTRALAHPVSGDWRPIDGRLELVAACNVNTAGFPVPRQLVASGQVMALVAAGAVAPAADNPEVMAERFADIVLERLTERLPELLDRRPAEPDTDRDLSAEDRERVLALQRDILLEQLNADPLGDSPTYAVRVGMTGAQLHVAELATELAKVEPELERDLAGWLSLDREAERELHADLNWLGDLEDRGELANWVTKTGGLHPYIKRIQKHLMAKGMSESRAIATARNVTKKMCATGDVNWPGLQQVNAGSRAEACAAVADWNRKAASA